jgi:hypothetical protein
MEVGDIDRCGEEQPPPDFRFDLEQRELDLVDLPGGGGGLAGMAFGEISASL